MHQTPETQLLTPPQVLLLLPALPLRQGKTEESPGPVVTTTGRTDLVVTTTARTEGLADSERGTNGVLLEEPETAPELCLA